MFGYVISTRVWCTWLFPHKSRCCSNSGIKRTAKSLVYSNESPLKMDSDVPETQKDRNRETKPFQSFVCVLISFKSNHIRHTRRRLFYLIYLIYIL